MEHKCDKVACRKEILEMVQKVNPENVSTITSILVTRLVVLGGDFEKANQDVHPLVDDFEKEELQALINTYDNLLKMVILVMQLDSELLDRVECFLKDTSVVSSVVLKN